MNQDQLGVYLSECPGDVGIGCHTTRSVFAEPTALQFGHQPRDPRRMRKLESAFANIDASILSRPRINGSEPKSMEFADVRGRKAAA
jgi:hypothetical protein